MSRANDIYEKIRINGIKAIDDFIVSKKSEELFLDFKRSADTGAGNVLNQDDKNNLAKAISGFGNSEGGVIVWGIDCSRSSSVGDVASTKFPIENVKRFVSLIEGALSGLTLPPHTKVENFPIQTKSTGEGFVVTLIPQNKSMPIQSLYNKQFYIRAGSNFEPTPYQVLSGMFGKQPQPNAYVMFTFGPAEIEDKTIHARVGVMFHNEGPGIARDLYLGIKVLSAPDVSSQLKFETVDPHWTGEFTFGRFMNLISKPEIRLAPGAFLQPVILNFSFQSPITADLNIEISCGCEGAAPMKTNIRNDKKTIERVWNKYVKNYNPNWTTRVRHQIVTELLGRKL